MNGAVHLYLTPIDTTEGRIDGLLGGALQDDLIWAMRPKLSIDLVAAMLSEMGRTPPARRSRRTEIERVLRRAVRGVRGREGRHATRRAARTGVSTGPWMSRTDGVLRLWGSENQRLAVGSDRERSVPIPTIHAGEPHHVDARGADRDLQLGALRDAFPSQAQAIDALHDRAVVMRRRIVAALEETEPRTVVVGSTEHLYTRLMVVEARRRGIPSVYVPHAPAAINRIYGDLPADLSLLANVGDREYYLELGAAPDRLVVIGDPMVSMSAPSGDHGRRSPKVVVFATTADRPPADLRHALDSARSSLSGTGVSLLVAPHPRDRRVASAVVDDLGLTLHMGRTETVFADHDVAVFLTEAASGAALSAVRAGVPVLRWSGVPNYVFEEQLRIDSADADGAALRAALQEPCPVFAGSVDRWRGPVGDAAVDARETHLGGSPAAAGPTLDSWGLWS